MGEHGNGEIVMTSDDTDRCPFGESRKHTVQEHDIAVDPETGYPTTVGVCVDCGRRQWRTEPEDYHRSVARDSKNCDKQEESE